MGAKVPFLGGWENGANTKNTQFLWVKEAIFQFVPLLKPFQLFISPFNVKNQLKF